MEGMLDNPLCKVLSVREYNAVSDPILITINENHDIVQIPTSTTDAIKKDDVVFKKLNMYMVERGWNSVLYNSILTITQINIRETIRLVPFIGENVDREIINIKFELTPDYNNFEMYDDKFKL